jgi:hypothetical protein
VVTVAKPEVIALMDSLKSKLVNSFFGSHTMANDL